MGKKRAAAAPVFRVPAAAAEQDHFSDYGFDAQFLRFFSQPETELPSTGHHHPPPPPLESVRFKLQKPISKKHRSQQQHQQQRRRWWSSAASAALLLFKRPSDNRAAAAVSSFVPPPSTPPPAPAGPLYFADDDGDGVDACTCWAPAMRSGHLAAAELGAASATVPYVSLRDARLRGAGSGAAAVTAPAMPIYLVT
ncbi:hypothetical protein ACP70R_034540 [Stipagrostis hirtigluma subsp. patula]